MGTAKGASMLNEALGEAGLKPSDFRMLSASQQRALWNTSFDKTAT